MRLSEFQVGDCFALYAGKEVKVPGLWFMVVERHEHTGVGGRIQARLECHEPNGNITHFEGQTQVVMVAQSSFLKAERRAELERQSNTIPIPAWPFDEANVKVTEE